MFITLLTKSTILQLLTKRKSTATALSGLENKLATAMSVALFSTPYKTRTSHTYSCGKGTNIWLYTLILLITNPSRSDKVLAPTT